MWRMEVEGRGMEVDAVVTLAEHRRQEFLS
jgi:hypothetical protein